MTTTTPSGARETLPNTPDPRRDDDPATTDPRTTVHPTGDEQAAANAENEPAG